MRITDLNASQPPDIQASSSSPWSPVSIREGIGRFYLVHIRKTAGTSLNHMFLSLADSDHEAFHQALANKEDHRLERNGKAFVGWNEDLINQGRYFYAFSHTPYFRLNLPEDTFAFTVFRDPVSRVISHYNMLMGLRINDIDHPCMLEEGPWISQGFEGFLDRMPKAHLLNQLYMFSEKFDVAEALGKVGQLHHLFYTERFEAGVEAFNRKTGLNLTPLRERVSLHRCQIAKILVERLREMLEPEYRFLRQTKALVADPVMVPDWLA